MCRAAYSGLGVDLAAGVRTGRLAGGPTIQQIPRDPVRAMGEEAAAREARIADALRCLRNITVQMTPAKPTPFKVPLARCAHPGGTCPNNCQDRPVAPTPLSRWWTDELSSGNYGDEWRVLEDF